MKHITLGVLLFATTFVFAQENSEQPQPAESSTEEPASTDSSVTESSATDDSALAQTATLETASEQSPADEALPERTLEGYRIIRIQKTETKAFKDSVKRAERQIEEDKKPTIPFRFEVGLLASIGAKELFGSDRYAYYDRDRTSKEIEPVTLFHGYPVNVGLIATIPLNEATVAIKVGALFEYTNLIHNEDFFLKTNDSDESPWFEEKKREPEHGNISQMRVSFPLLFALKGRTTPAMFEVGSKISIPIQDKYKSVDFVDHNIRPAVDAALLIGGSFIINKYFTLMTHIEAQWSEIYDDELFVGVSDISLLGIHVGLVFTPF
jgi:hypothetical protein